MLVEKGASAQIYAEDGRGALWLAATRGHLDVCKWLVEDVKVPVNSYGGNNLATPLDMASDRNHPTVAAYLESKGGKRYKDIQSVDVKSKKS